MREIFFRGQTRRKGQKVWMDGSPVEGNWVYGGVCHGTGDFSIIYGNLDEERERPTEKWVVYTDTVGQFTGLTDKNGTKIFEGDILSTHFDFNNPEDESRTVVEWGNFRWVTHQPGYEPDEITDFDKGLWTVIGNIHDNPELIGGV